MYYSTINTPSQVWIPSLLFTGIVPSPDSIFVRNWPLARLLGCLSMDSFSSWGEKILASPQGAVFMYKWNWIPCFNLNPFLAGSSIDSALISSVCSSNCLYKYSQRHRRATTSAWQSFTAPPLTLKCSPETHFVPFEKKKKRYFIIDTFKYSESFV